ncbi:aminotransferase class IV [Marinobacter sp. SS21]|uniref:aminotransferase class IV n=1 Tax=Marinobacter sp. SS21 TaxID=2979460 RepID=UPI00232F6EF1|nr:aminotransferase class IV [Marinobacter sp. SS21]MDC0663459.1 aminotransferase class IV [Marinobacter sp. SS21]
MLVWAEQAPIDASDRGLAYGDGVFETIRVYRGGPILLRQHLHRMLMGARRLGIALTGDQLADSVAQALARYAASDDWVLKLILTRGSGGRGYVPSSVGEPCLICSRHDTPAQPDSSGVIAQVAQHPLVVNPALAGLKSLNRLDQVMASMELRPGVYDVLLTDGAGRLLEGGRTNVLLHHQSGWMTPPVRSVAVHGIMLDYVTASLQAAGRPVRERPIPLSMLNRPGCLGLYLLNSVVGVVPVRRVGCQHLPIDRTLATICAPLTSLK